MQKDNSKGPTLSHSEDSLAADGPQIDERTKALLGRALQAHYDDLVTAPIPDRFLVLLAQLEAKEARDE
jgi:hypothetical protein